MRLAKDPCLDLCKDSRMRHVRAKRVVLGGEFAPVRPSLSTYSNCKGLEEPGWVLEEPTAMVVPGRVQAHKQTPHGADPQDVGAWSHGDHAGEVFAICSQAQSWHPTPAALGMGTHAVICTLLRRNRTKPINGLPQGTGTHPAVSRAAPIAMTLLP